MPASAGVADPRDTQRDSVHQPTVAAPDTSRRMGHSGVITPRRTRPAPTRLAPTRRAIQSWRRSAVREVLADLLRWWQAGETRRRRHRDRHLPLGAAAARCGHAGRPGRHRGRLGVRRLCRGRGLRAGDRRLGAGRATAPAAVRGVRRRRLHRRADLRRHHRRLRRGDLAGRPSPSSVPWRRRSRPDEPVALATITAGARTRSAVTWWSGRPTSPADWAASDWTTPFATTPAACWPPAGPPP